MRPVCHNWVAVRCFPRTDYCGPALCSGRRDVGCRRHIRHILFPQPRGVGGPLFRAGHGADSIGPLGTTWAIIGLRKASKSLSRMIQGHGKGLTFYTSFAEFLARLTFSVMLLFYPAEKFETHVVLLGLELIAVSIRLTRRLSPALDVEE